MIEIGPVVGGSGGVDMATAAEGGRAALGMLREAGDGKLVSGEGDKGPEVGGVAATCRAAVPVTSVGDDMAWQFRVEYSCRADVAEPFGMPENACTHNTSTKYKKYA